MNSEPPEDQRNESFVDDGSILAREVSRHAHMPLSEGSLRRGMALRQAIIFLEQLDEQVEA